MKIKERNIIIALVAVLIIALVGVFYIRGPTLSIAGCDEYNYFCSSGKLISYVCGERNENFGGCLSGQNCKISAYPESGTFAEPLNFNAVQYAMCGSGSVHLYTCSMVNGHGVVYEDGSVLLSCANIDKYSYCLKTSETVTTEYSMRDVETKFCGIPEESCKDTDGGSNENVKGIVSGFDANVAYSYSDACDSIGKRLQEFFCVGTKTWNSAYIDCAYGCTNGACNLQTSNIVYTCANSKITIGSGQGSFDCAVGQVCKETSYAASGSSSISQIRAAMCKDGVIFPTPFPTPSPPPSPPPTIIAPPVTCKAYEAKSGDICSFSLTNMMTTEGLKAFATDFMFQLIFVAGLLILVIILLIMLLSRKKTVIL